MITRQEVEEAQASWGRAVVDVGNAGSWEDARGLAVALVEEHYRVSDDTLLFSPTRAAEHPFRTTASAAISYFVGRDEAFAEDHGFALEPWRAVRFENAGVAVRGEVAMAMGHYYFTRVDGTELQVEYSFAYVRGAAGRLEIQLHHSALPYRP